MKPGQAMHEANNRFNERKAKRSKAKLLAEAEQRQIEYDRQLQVRLKQEFYARREAA